MKHIDNNVATSLYTLGLIENRKFSIDELVPVIVMVGSSLAGFVYTLCTC